MKQIQKTKEGKNFSAISVGKMSELRDYVLSLGESVKIQGKVFVGNALGANGSEMSFQSFAPGEGTGFLHTHKEHEELYIFLSGKGEFSVDGETTSIEEGSVVRVSPQGKRAVRNVGNSPLVMLCIQYRSHTFTSEDAADACILPEAVEW